MGTLSDMMSKRPTRLDYCQCLLVSQINYAITNYADHMQKQMSHDAINRYRRDDRLTRRLVWENVRSQIQANGPARSADFILRETLDSGEGFSTSEAQLLTDIYAAE